MPSLLVYASGWLAGSLIAVAVAESSLNYVLGRFGRGQVAWLSRWHYRFGLTAAGVSFLHTVVSITRSSLPVRAEIGLWLASAAVGLIAIQVVIGASMRTTQGPALRRTRRYHVAIAPALLIAVALHVALNGALPAS